MVHPGQVRPATTVPHGEVPSAARAGHAPGAWPSSRHMLCVLSSLLIVGRAPPTLSRFCSLQAADAGFGAVIDLNLICVLHLYWIAMIHLKGNGFDPC